MDIEQAAIYWESRLREGRPIYRVKVRRLLELAGSERRGYVIVQKIQRILQAHGLETVPDFQNAWIDSQVRVRLIEENPAESKGGLDYEEEVALEDSALDPALSEHELPASEGETSPETLDAPNVSQDQQSQMPVSPASTDPVVRVASLASANQGVMSVSVDDPLESATTKMLFENFSQLVVMQGGREVKGVISWETIARRSMQSPPPTTVRDCMIEARIVNATDALFDTFPLVEKYGYVLVRDKGKITGIVTATDFATELLSMSQAFMTIGTIERLVRMTLHPCLQNADFALLEPHSRALADRDFGRLTFGENVRLLERPEVWARMNLKVDKAEFTRRVKVIGEIRNDIMHFGPDPLSTSQTKSLDQMLLFLRAVLV